MIEVRSADAERLARDLAGAAEQLPGSIHEAEQEVARKTAEKARARASGLGGLPAHVAPALVAEDNKVKLESGGNWAMAPGAEYGRDRYHVHPYHGADGYFLTPTIRDGEDDRFKVYDDAADKALRKVN